jgi:hypothetical protein
MRFPLLLEQFHASNDTSFSLALRLWLLLPLPLPLPLPPLPASAASGHVSPHVALELKSIRSA